MRQHLWFDLNAHVMAHLPIPQDDASGLHNPAYIHWYQRAHAQCCPDPAEIPHTLSHDAAILVTHYVQSPQSHLLQAYVLLHPTLDDFLANARHPLSPDLFDDPGRRVLAMQLLDTLPSTLLELFRINLWTEFRRGFAKVHRQMTRPLFEDACVSMRPWWERANASIPSVDAVDWLVSLPLAACGRVLEARPSRAHRITIAYGLPCHWLLYTSAAPDDTQW